MTQNLVKSMKYFVEYKQVEHNWYQVDTIVLIIQHHYFHFVHLEQFVLITQRVVREFQPESVENHNDDLVKPNCVNI